MKIGLIPINMGVKSLEEMIALAQHAESCGVESVWTFEHTMVPVEYASKYPYNRSGSMGAEPDTQIIDPLIALAAVAAATKTLRLGTGVNIVAQANPLFLAKQAASLDFLSGGRFMLGAGIGWLHEEFDAMGVPWERRGARFDDYMVAMKKVWSGDVVEHKSDFINWSGFKSYPLPAQKPGVPIIMGGSKGKIFERIAKHGDGWFAPSTTPEDLAPMLDQLKAACSEFGRDYDSVEITSMWTTQGGLDSLKTYAEIGVSRVIVPSAALGGDTIAGISRLADDIIAKV